jgi:hypothetical protein
MPQLIRGVTRLRGEAKTVAARPEDGLYVAYGPHAVHGGLQSYDLLNGTERSEDEGRRSVSAPAALTDDAGPQRGRTIRRGRELLQPLLV